MADRIMGVLQFLSFAFIKAFLAMRESTAPMAATGKMDIKRQSSRFTDISPPKERAAPAVAAISPCPSLVGSPKNHANPDHKTTDKSAATTAGDVYSLGMVTAKETVFATAGKKSEKSVHPKKERTAFIMTDDLSVIVFDATAPVTQFAQSVAPSTNKAAAKMKKDKNIKHLPLKTFKISENIRLIFLKYFFAIDKSLGISYYISMDINVFDDKIEKNVKVKVISDQKPMTDMLTAVLSPLFCITDKSESLTVVCMSGDLPEIFGPAIYVGRGPKNLPDGSICLSRPLDIEEFIGHALLLCKKSTGENDGWSFDRKEHTVTYNGESLTLTKKEEELFLLLLSNIDSTVKRKDIENALWDGKDVGNSADVYICHLKKKLEKLAGPGCLITVRGQGYMLKRP